MTNEQEMLEYVAQCLKEVLEDKLMEFAEHMMEPISDEEIEKMAEKGQSEKQLELDFDPREYSEDIEKVYPVYPDDPWEDSDAQFRPNLSSEFLTSAAEYGRIVEAEKLKGRTKYVAHFDDANTYNNIDDLDEIMEEAKEMLVPEPWPSLTELDAEVKQLYSEHPELNGNIDPNAWIQTYTGKKFYPQNPTPDSICIEDIAHALSMQCRFGGHVSEFVSVAQHCVLVSYLCDENNRLCALLHDASEAYLWDCPSPIKRMLELQGYKLLEKKVQQAIYAKWGISEEPKDVKRADLMALSIEANTFMYPLHLDWEVAVKAPPLKVVPLSPKDAEKLFLDRFGELTNA